MNTISTATIDTASNFEVILHRGRLVCWTTDSLHNICAGDWLVSRDGERARVEDVLLDGRCTLSWDETETTECVVGWTMDA